MDNSRSLGSLLQSHASSFREPSFSSLPFENGKFQTLFEEIEEIGNGGFGKVLKATHKLDRGVYAIKVVKIEELPSTPLAENMQRALREVSAMVNLNHPGIVRYITCWLEKSSDKKLLGETTTSLSSQGTDREESKTGEVSHNSQFSFERSQGHVEESSKESNTLQGETICLFIQLEFCKGQTLKDYIESKVPDSIVKKLEIFIKILGGVNVYHSKSIIHRDLKPANIFFESDSETNVKIGDFGLAVNYFDNIKSQKDTKSVSQQLELTKEVGTNRYMSPEMKDPKAAYDSKTDIYALGIILFEMLISYGSEMERNLLLDDLTKNRKFSEDFLKQYEEESKVILRMIDPKPADRPNGGPLAQEISEIKKCYENQKYKEGKAIIIGYDNIKSMPSGKISSFMVEDSKSVFNIMQGLKGDLLTKPPALGREVVYKHIEYDRKGRPANAVFISIV